MVAAPVPLHYLCMMKTLLLGALFALAACGGSKSEADEPARDEPQIKKPAELSAEDSKLAKFEAQKQGTCEPMCERLTECAVQDLRENKSPEEVAKMELDKIAPIHTQECNDDCKSRDLSPRQVQVVRNCLGVPHPCAEFRECLSAANKR